MERTIRRTISAILLLSYAFVAAAGNTVLLREILNSGEQQHQYAAGKDSSTLPGSPVWTVKSNIQQVPASEQSVHTGPVVLFIDADLLPQAYDTPKFRSKYTYLESLPSKPRDPPLA